MFTFCDTKLELKGENKMKKSRLLVFSIGTVFAIVACNSGNNKNVTFTLHDPENTSQCTENCQNYVDAMREQQNEIEDDYKMNTLFGNQGVDIANYADPNNGPYSDVNTGVELTFEVEEKNPCDCIPTVKVSRNEDMSDPETYSGVNSVTVKNLYANTKYYWQVEQGNEKSEVKEFTTGDYPRWIDCKPLFNVRDCGGYMTSSGQRVKQGLVYRGAEIANNEFSRSGERHIQTVTEESKKVFRDVMKIGVEIDLRNSGENENGAYTACGFAEDGDIDYHMWGIGSYANYIKEPKNCSDIFDTLANADEKPVYFHCYGGADRTGTIAFLLNAILGVSYTDLVIDFELTSYSSIITRECKRSHLREGQWDHWPALESELKKQTTWDANDSLKDNVERYLVQKAGVKQTTIDKIRSIMLESAE